MDGIAAVKNYIILFEFKCPFSRIPDDKIPIHYEYQVKAGLDTIPIADMGIYAEAVFRISTPSKLHDNSYNTTFHKEHEVGDSIS